MMQDTPTVNKEPILGKTSPVEAVKSVIKGPKKTILVNILIGIVVVSLGVLAGYLISGGKVKNAPIIGGSEIKTTSNEAGFADESKFSNNVEGVLEEGGTGGEGTHHLVRDGGPSQNVYLTSSVLDLGSFVGKKVKVWGDTVSSRKAGWLMEVGKLKVIE